MKTRISKVISLVLALSLITVLPIYSQTLTVELLKDYSQEVQINQFTPHGGDREEIENFMTNFVKNLNTATEVNKMLVNDTTEKTAIDTYILGLKDYKEIKIVETTVEKLYKVEKYDVFNNYRAIIKFKYLGYTKDGTIIEKTDLLGAAKLGKNPEDWKLWGIIWNDSGINVSDASLEQLDKPKSGEEVCIMTTSIGTLKIRLFPDKAPRTVRNFKTLAQKGYYNNTEFFRVINDFMIQGGSPDNTAEGGESIYGKYFEDELSRELFNLRGALSMGNEGFANSNGSQFYIVQRPKVDPQHLNLASLPLNAEEKYKELGGCPHLDMRYTVFGQVYEGLELVDTIAAAKTDDNARPLKDPVTVLKIEFVTIK
ncbi:MAG: peptidylprolyl isomerase [Filifactoraceae bacterium]